MAYAGFDFNPTAYLFDIGVRCLSLRQRGQLMTRVMRAMEEGDEAFLRSQPFIGRLYRVPAARPSISAARRRAVLERDGAFCRQCLATERLEIDHIFPVVWGGTHAMENLQVLCKPCNLRKGPTAHAKRPEENNA